MVSSDNTSDFFSTRNVPLGEYAGTHLVSCGNPQRPLYMTSIHHEAPARKLDEELAGQLCLTPPLIVLTGWKDVPGPGISWDILKIPPRKRLKPMEDLDQRNDESLKAGFGDVTVMYVDAERSTFMNETQDAWTTGFRVVALFYIPTLVLFKEPQVITVNPYIQLAASCVKVARKRRRGGEKGNAARYALVTAKWISFNELENVLPRTFPSDCKIARRRIARGIPSIEENSCQRQSPCRRNINLELCPSLDLKSYKKVECLNLHLTRAFSSQEQGATNSSAFTNVKNTIRSIFLESVEFDGTQVPFGVFGLRSADYRDEVHAIIFVNDFRLDPSSHAVLADACVLPVTGDVMPNIALTLEELSRRGYTTFPMERDEMRVWRRLFPVLAESCRSWEHDESCEFISVSAKEVGAGDSMMCRCGRGKDLGWFEKRSEWREVAPYVTRVALDPLATVSLLESLVAESDSEPELVAGCWPEDESWSDDSKGWNSSWTAKTNITT